MKIFHIKPGHADFQISRKIIAERHLSYCLSCLRGERRRKSDCDIESAYESEDNKRDTLADDVRACMCMAVIYLCFYTYYYKSRGAISQNEGGG